MLRFYSAICLLLLATLLQFFAMLIFVGNGPNLVSQFFTVAISLLNFRMIWHLCMTYPDSLNLVIDSVRGILFVVISNMGTATLSGCVRSSLWLILSITVVLSDQRTIVQDSKPKHLIFRQQHLDGCVGDEQ